MRAAAGFHAPAAAELADLHAPPGIVGIVDDRWGLDALTKFVGQVTAAGVLVIMGVSWIVIYDPFSASTLVLDQLQGGLITVAVAAALLLGLHLLLRRRRNDKDDGGSTDGGRVSGDQALDGRARDDETSDGDRPAGDGSGGSTSHGGDGSDAHAPSARETDAQSAARRS